MNSRLKKLYCQLTKADIDGLWVSSSANITYLLQYASRDSYLIASKRGTIFITDSRYTQEARQFLKGKAVILTYKGDLFKTIASACKGLGLARVGFEERYLPCAEFQKAREYLDDGVSMVACHGHIESLRQIKDDGELKKMRRAVRITLDALEFIQDFLVPGVREVEVAAELERFIRYEGARASSFETIVAFGPNASLPHHMTSKRKLITGEMVLIDMGVDYEGYKSDLTRTFILGKITPLARKAYDVVKKAQTRAIRLIRPGIPASKVDAVVRQFIAEQGFGNYFGHNLGHGVGLEVHEAPNLSVRDTTLLAPGMVLTVEPGIYLPGKLGVRIEDMVLVTEKGTEVISGTIDQ